MSIHKLTCLLAHLSNLVHIIGQIISFEINQSDYFKLYFICLLSNGFKLSIGLSIVYSQLCSIFTIIYYSAFCLADRTASRAGSGVRMH